MAESTNSIKVIFNNVRIDSDKKIIVDKLNLEIRSGELVYFYGPPQSGTQALIKSIYRDIKISSGSAKVLDINVKEGTFKELSFLRKQLGLLLNEDMLIPHLSVADNIKLFYSLHTGQQAINEADFKEALVSLNLNPETYVGDLNEIEKLKLRFTISISSNPKIYLIENAIDRFDLKIQSVIMGELISRARNSGLTILISTENQSLINQFPGRVFHCLNNEFKEIT